MPRVHRLPDATFPLNGSEIMILNQSSITTRGVQQVTKKAPIADVIGGGSSLFSGARTLTVIQAITAGPVNLIAWEDVLYDTGPYWSDSAPASLTVPNTGYYHVGAYFGIGDGADTPPLTRSGSIVSNGSPDISTVQFAALTDSGPAYVSLSGDTYLTSGDTVGLSIGTYGGDDTITATMWIHEIAGVPPPPPVPPVAPTFTSADSDTMTVGSGATFTVTASGTPVIGFSLAGTLPTGITWTAPTLSGTPGPGTAGTYAETFTATNAAGSTTQAFTLTVLQPYLLLDHFVDPDGTDLTTHTMDVGSGWTSLAGSWVIESDQAELQTSAGQNVIVADPGTDTYTLTAVFTPGNSAYDGQVAFNVVDINNYYFVSAYQDDTLRLFRCATGVYIEILSFALTLTPGTAYTLTVQIIGGLRSIVSVDGTPFWDYTDMSGLIAPSSLCGLRQGSDTLTTWSLFSVV